MQQEQSINQNYHVFSPAPEPVARKGCMTRHKVTITVTAVAFLALSIYIGYAYNYSESIFFENLRKLLSSSKHYKFVDNFPWPTKRYVCQKYYERQIALCPAKCDEDFCEKNPSYWPSDSIINLLFSKHCYCGLGDDERKSLHFSKKVK
jgi:hypothetical protein